MNICEVIVPASRLGQAESLPPAPCLFVDGGNESVFPPRIALPSCPVILIGEAPDAFAQALDFRVVDRAAAEAVLRRVADNPHAAAVTIGLLRALPDLSLSQGLLMESLAYGVLQGSGEYHSWLERREKRQMPVAEGQVRAERNEATLTLMLDRAQAGNAIDRSMRDALDEMLQLASLDDTIEQVRLGALGKTFSLGADLDEFGTTRDPALAHAIRQATLPARWASLCGHKMAVHIDGACVGAGLELAAFAHRITATPRAWFQLPELAMGLLPGAGGCVSLTRRIGHQRTAQMILSGRRISAQTALEWGLVDEIATNESGAHV